MYATAQRVQDREGHTAIHTFVHRHDPSDCPFPADPRTVPQSAPGRLVWRDTHDVPPGGNAVLSYVDLVVPDEQWSANWTPELQSLAKFTGQLPVPFEERVGPVLVIFNAVDDHRDSGEFASLLKAVLNATLRTAAVR